MCDYSLMSLPNRLAEEGDHLVVHRFPTGTIGLVAAKIEPPETPPQPQNWWWKVIEWLREPDDSTPCVVCIPPGARLVLRDITPAMQHELSVGSSAIVTFTHIGVQQNTHRDAVRFVTGQELLLQKLTPGQRADVLSLSLAEDSRPMPAWPDATRRHAVIS